MRNLMELQSNLIRTSLKDRTCSVSWRNIMHYAAAINDNNPYYFDDERDGGFIAHPLFPVSLTLPIVENLSDYISNESVADFPYEYALYFSTDNQNCDGCLWVYFCN